MFLCCALDDKALHVNMRKLVFSLAECILVKMQVLVTNDVCLLLQGTYAVVEFAERDGVQSLLESTAVPSISHESVVPLRSRLLSFRNVFTMDSTNKQTTHQSQPLRTVAINDLIQQLSSEESVSD